jgi:3-oxoadipate enol-lactonase
MASAPPSADPSMTDDGVAYADLGDVTICHRLAGPEDGPRVVYVSGSGSDLRRAPNALSSPFVDRCRVLAYDHRGLGRSTTGDGQPTMVDFARDLLRLLDHVGWDTCGAVGISFGGMVLMEAAVTEPQRFGRCVLACTSPGGAGRASFPLHELIGLPDDERRERWLDVLDDRNADPERRAVVRSVIESMDAAKGRAPGEPFYSPGEVAQLRARRHHDCFDRLPAMEMPVLIAAGRYDGIAPPANQEAMAAQLPDARIEWFQGGHAFFVEDRTAYPAMVQFLVM